ncbi:uncharacterized protein METZ01_LOCUS365243 [marine metagenome]|uniref:Uncharacterized protein n=1 Tax=marine metagenome TaxID=408172 RepID=A0A382SR38_9ZZZZ
MQLKKPRFWRGFFWKVQDKFSTMLKTKPKERGPSILITLHAFSWTPTWVASILPRARQSKVVCLLGLFSYQSSNRSV